MWPFPHNARAQVTFTTLMAFDGTNGAVPEAALIEGSVGSFYGTTMEGGAYTNFGTVFEITTNGVFRNLISFNSTNGAFPQAGLTQDAEGNLWGTTYLGGTFGDGTLFKIATNGSFTSFPFSVADGDQPNAVLVQGTNGSYYGTTQFGGTNGYGSVFQFTQSGVVTTVTSFNGTNGSYPYDSGLLPGVEGNDFYGVAAFGGDGFDPAVTYSGWGTIFKVTTGGLLTNLAFFHGTNGAFPVGVLVRGMDGNLYGTTGAGGIGFDGTTYSGYGTVFKITGDSTLTTLFWFNSTNNGAYPFAGLALGADGNLYGTTQQGGTNYPPNPNSGTVFQVTPEGKLTTLVSFGANNGFPIGGLVQGSDGDFYGTTTSGSTNGYGGIFRLHVPGAASSRLQCTPKPGGGISFNWIPLRGRTYELQYSTNFAGGNWTNLGLPMTSTNSPATASDTIAPGAGQRFYRLLLVP
jgi:uncharacterized repeat protein (TIGR03803 family)